MVNKILIDTNVWLDLAKDHRKAPVLTALDDLIRTGAVELIVPNIVFDEFARNRDRVIEQRRRSLSSHIRHVREAVVEFGDEEKRSTLFAQLDYMEYNVAAKGDRSHQTLDTIEGLIKMRPIAVASDNAKLKAVERALSKRAPFHRSKNSMADALLIEVFVEALEVQRNQETRFFFVTLNTRDFSQHDGDRRLPHTDFEPIFRADNCIYATSIVEVINEIDGELLSELEWDESYSETSRGLSEILEAEQLLDKQVWYDRHMSRRIRVENGDVRLITRAEFAKLDGYRADVIVKDIWEGALAAAQRTEEEVGRDQLGPWDDFEWGMINGKLSALRWVLGEDWDMLDT